MVLPPDVTISTWIKMVDLPELSNLFFFFFFFKSSMLQIGNLKGFFFLKIFWENLYLKSTSSIHNDLKTHTILQAVQAASRQPQNIWVNVEGTELRLFTCYWFCNGLCSESTQYTALSNYSKECASAGLFSGGISPGRSSVLLLKLWEQRPVFEYCSTF